MKWKPCLGRMRLHAKLSIPWVAALQQNHGTDLFTTSKTDARVEEGEEGKDREGGGGKLLGSFRVLAETKFQLVDGTFVRSPQLLYYMHEIVLLNGRHNFFGCRCQGAPETSLGRSASIFCEHLKIFPFGAAPAVIT